MTFLDVKSAIPDGEAAKAENKKHRPFVRCRETGICMSYDDPGKCHQHLVGKRKLETAALLRPSFSPVTSETTRPRALTGDLLVDRLQTASVGTLLSLMFDTPPHRPLELVDGVVREPGLHDLGLATCYRTCGPRQSA